MSVQEAFNSSVEYYDDWMRKALPGYKDLWGTAKELIPFDEEAALDVLDLGAGTGLFSKFVLEKYPRANFVLYDLADRMLEVARDRFGPAIRQFQFVVGDYRKIEATHEFDLVISSLSIHHLVDEEKRELFKRIYGLLRYGGLFINIDQVRGETNYLKELYWSHWLNRVRRSGADEAQISESVARRVAYDHDASLADQLQWLREAGFTHVDCVYKNYFVGVFLAMKHSETGVVQ